MGARWSKRFAISRFYFLRLTLFGARFLDNDFLDLYFSGKVDVEKTVIFKATNIRVLDYNVRS